MSCSSIISRVVFYLFVLISVVVWCVSAAGGVFRVPVLCVVFYRGCAVSGDGLGGGSSGHVRVAVEKLWQGI
jgi:hypothetical protein